MNCATSIQTTNTLTLLSHPAYRTDKPVSNKAAFFPYPVVHPLKTPDQMLRIIAITLNMDPKSYGIKSRRQNFTELRFIAALFLRRYFPGITLHQVAGLFGGQDHSSVINGMRRAQSLLQTRDPKFIKKYTLVLRAIEIWMKQAPVI
jgi:hypothetical protein